MFFVNSEILELQMWRKKLINLTNLKLRQNSVNPICYPNALFVFLLTGATLYYHAIYIVFTYFASFTGYEDDMLKLFLIYMFKDPNLAEI